MSSRTNQTMWAPMQYNSLSFGIFKTISASEASLMLGKLLQQVSLGSGRVQIVADGEGSDCVLLSKVELESLERALAILSGTKGAEEMREQLIAIATATRASVSAPAHAI